METALQILSKTKDPKVYLFNENHVCINADMIFEWWKDRYNHLSFHVAQHPANGRWCLGVNYMTNIGSINGQSNAPSLNPQELGAGCTTILELLKPAIKYWLNEKEIDDQGRAALKAFSISLGIIEPGDQLLLF